MLRHLELPGFAPCAQRDPKDWIQDAHNAAIHGQGDDLFRFCILYTQQCKACAAPGHTTKLVHSLECCSCM